MVRATKALDTMLNKEKENNAWFVLFLRSTELEIVPGSIEGLPTGLPRKLRLRGKPENGSNA